MCCCFVTQCCCGCTSLKVGVMVWAIIDALVNLFMVIFAVTTAGAKFVNWWGILVLVVDFVLAIGAHLENTGLMLVWQIVMMINIVILFIMWLVIPVVVLGVGILASVASEVKCDELDSLAESNGFNTGFSGNDLCNAAKDNTGIAMGVLVVIGVFIVTLPLIYLYWWIVVNSLRKRIVEDKRQILPVQQPVVFATTQQPPPYPTGYQDDPSKY